MDQGALYKLESLPAVPLTVHSILRAINEPNTSVEEIAEVLRLEPGLTAKLVGSANAAFFTGQRPVFTVEDAAIRLGLKRVKMIALSILIGNRFNASKCPPFSIRRYWARALMVATTAGQLAERVPDLEASPDVAYLCGLVHNMGLLVNATAFPAAMTEVLERHMSYPDLDMRELEREFLGFDHIDSGVLVLRRWDMPEPVLDVVANCHGAEDYDGGYPNLVALLGMARQWVANDFGDVPDVWISRYFDDKVLASVRSACEREQAHIDALAGTVAAVAA